MRTDQLIAIAIAAASIIFVLYAFIRARSARSHAVNAASKDTQHSDREPGLNANRVLGPTESPVNGHVNQNGKVVKKGTVNKELFLDHYRSIYSVLADKNNSKRQLYFPTSSEKLIWFYLEILYKGDPTSDKLADLCNISASNILAGYCFRTTEEALANTKSSRIEVTEVTALIKKHQENEKREMGQDYQYYV
jgi:hypothetical protein